MRLSSALECPLPSMQTRSVPRPSRLNVARRPSRSTTICSPLPEASARISLSSTSISARAVSWECPCDLKSLLRAAAKPIAPTAAVTAAAIAGQLAMIRGVMTITVLMDHLVSMGLQLNLPACFLVGPHHNARRGPRAAAGPGAHAVQLLAYGLGERYGLVQAGLDQLGAQVGLLAEGVEQGRDDRFLDL